MPNQSFQLFKNLIDTPLGKMILVSDQYHLYMSEFIERKNLDTQLENLQIISGSRIKFGNTHPIDFASKELSQYFTGKLQEFNTPIQLLGTPFQQSAWNILKQIPFGSILSYGQQAKKMGMPNAFRAVARANSMNQLALIIPCHRIINGNGALGGYAGGIERKSWLLAHEKSYKQAN